MEKKISVLGLVIAVIFTLTMAGCKTGDKAGLISTGKAGNPFEVKVGGQKAGNHNGSFANIPKPVSGSAELEILLKPESDIIINIFGCDSQGKNTKGQAEVIIIPDKGTKTKISDKMADKKPLKPGNYLMNVVGNGKTAQIFFIVK